MLSFVPALMMRIMPMPPEWFVFNPDWVALLLIYWSLVAPDRVSIFTAWFAGLIADALTGRLLGQHGLGYVIMVYLNIRVRQYLLNLPMPLQCLWVLLILLIAQLLILWTQRIEMADSMQLSYWFPSISGALLWPLVMWGLQVLNRPASRT